ncbi:unnamed protein product [Orchesella dallaii]|uniref:Uncharacterized protein n=1 Tax=Orchesella dallaii TaxID=48710 RepID=A0ABP1R049_9HEXA
MEHKHTTTGPSPGGFPVYTVNSLESAYIQQKRSDKGRTSSVSILQLINCASIVVLTLCIVSCMIALQRNAQIMEKNVELLERQLRYQSIYGNNGAEMVKFDRMINLKDACPPCPTTEPPSPIAPYRNPVSVLNEEVKNNAKYDVKHVCIDPPIHICTLKIEKDPAFANKNWSGRGHSIQSAKQEAAWKCIQNDLPHLIGEVADEYKPPVEGYNPTCNRPTLE